MSRQASYRSGAVMVTAIIIGWTMQTARASEDWLDPWPYRKTIAISRTLAANTDQTNFPVLVRRTADADLAAHARADGADLLITAADGTTPLASEVEHFDPATGALVLWVRIPLLSTASNTFVHLYFGNPAASVPPDAAAVWDDDYAGVWHQHDASPTSIVESTTSGIVALKEGGADQPVEVPGRIGPAQDYTSTNSATGVKMIYDGTPYPAGSFSFWGMNNLHVTNDLAGNTLRISGSDGLHVFSGAPGSWDDYFVLNWGKL